MQENPKFELFSLNVSLAWFLPAKTVHDERNNYELQLNNVLAHKLTELIIFFLISLMV